LISIIIIITSIIIFTALDLEFFFLCFVLFRLIFVFCFFFF